MKTNTDGWLVLSVGFLLASLAATAYLVPGVAVAVIYIFTLSCSIYTVIDRTID